MKKKLIILGNIFIATVLLMESCQGTSTEEPKSMNSKIAINDSTALGLLNTKCFGCHNPDLTIATRIAPPIFKIRQHYLIDDSTTKSQFVERVLHYVTNPTEENSIMPGAVRNFGLMPKMLFNDEEVNAIAAYLYDVDVSSDAWYTMWDTTKGKLKAGPLPKTYTEIGLNYAMTTKTVLGKNLLTAIKQKGPESAITFCNTRAVELTDSMSTVLNAKIKRVSDKPRNINNQANEEELAAITKFKQQLSDKEKMTPYIIERNNSFIGYYPIETNKMCLQCHGKENIDISDKTLRNINKLYPKDKARGYSENQLRGIFVVEMKK